MTFEDAFRAYMTVSGEERSAAYQDRLMYEYFVHEFGRGTEVTAISPRRISQALATLRTKRITRKGVRVSLSPATINRHTQFLQRVLRHAEDLNEPVQKIRWRAFILVEGEQRIYPLTEEEEKHVIENIDDSVKPLFLFSLLSGVRLQNAIELRWSMIDHKLGEISFRGKSRRPGGKTYTVPITAPIADLIRQQQGNNDTYVFTYTAKRNDRHGHLRGRRYPLTANVVRYYWEALGLGKRWHDVRHTFGTRLYSVSRDIHLVQRAMNHSDVQTTLRYVHSNHEDIREAMSKMPFMFLNNHSSDEHNSDTKEHQKNIINLKRYQAGAAKRTRTSTGCPASTSRQSHKSYKDWEDDLD